MNIDNFALWKFKELDGKLKGFSSFDVFVSKVISNNGKTYKLIYNIKDNSVKLVDFLYEGNVIFECPFSKLVDNLKNMNLYIERTENRHSNSYISYEGKLE